jgi:hypothetical protein
MFNTKYHIKELFIKSDQEGNKLKVHKSLMAGKVTIISHIKIQSSANLFVKDDEEHYSERCKILREKSDK